MVHRALNSVWGGTARSTQLPNRHKDPEWFWSGEEPSWLLHSSGRESQEVTILKVVLLGTRWCVVHCPSKAPQFIDNFCTWLLTSEIRHAHVYQASSKSDIWSLVDQPSVRLPDFWPRCKGLSEFLKSLPGSSEQRKPRIFFPLCYYPWRNAEVRRRMLRIPSALLPAGHKVKKKKKKIHIKEPPCSQPILQMDRWADACSICVQSFKLLGPGQAPTENYPWQWMVKVGVCTDANTHVIFFF